MHLFRNCLKHHLSSFEGRLVALRAVTASRVEDFGLQAILEKMNSLITPLISGPFWDISNIFQKMIFSQSLSRQKIQLKVTLVVLALQAFLGLRQFWKDEFLNHPPD